MLCIFDMRIYVLRSLKHTITQNFSLCKCDTNTFTSDVDLNFEMARLLRLMGDSFTLS
jgi:hypothetical protein